MRRGILGRPELAAITMSPHGGGIAAVARLIDDVLADVTGRRVPRHLLASGTQAFNSSTLARLRFGFGLARAQTFGRCDWIFYSHLSLAAVQRYVPRVVARPYAVFLHDVEAWTPHDEAMRSVLANAFLRLANSRHTAEKVAAGNPGCGPILACPLALPAAVSTRAAARPPGHKGRRVVIVSRMVSTDRYKGHDALILAWPEVVARVPDAVLVCVGEGDDVPRMKRAAQAAGIGAHVEFTGFVDDETRAGIYAGACLLAMPSRREGFGLVYVEAMAAGLPCIGSVHDAASEVIVDGETGFLVDQDDRPTLVHRIVSVLTDETLRRRLGDAGLARYRAEFTYERFRDRLMDQLEGAMPASRMAARGPRREQGAA